MVPTRPRHMGGKKQLVSPNEPDEEQPGNPDEKGNDAAHNRDASLIREELCTYVVDPVEIPRAEPSAATAFESCDRLFPRLVTTMSESRTLLDAVSFDEEGLVPAIAQDVDTDRVLMMAYMTEETLQATLNTGRMVYWSRSRQEQWVKGATSGHTQQVESVRVDCDGDALLFRVRQEGGACHTGYKSCFFRRAEDGHLVEDGQKVFDPDQVYGAT